MGECQVCGAPVGDADLYCTECGSPVARGNAAVPAPPPYSDHPHADQVRVAPVEPSRSHPKRRTAVIVAIDVCVVALFAGIAVFLLSGHLSGAATAFDGRTVYYTSDEPLSVSGDTTLIAYGVDDEPLESYRVVLRPDGAASSPEWDSAALDVHGDDGFTFDGFASLPDGIYRMTIERTDGTDETYRCPDIRFESAGTAGDTVLLRPDPENPDDAIFARAVYDASNVTMDVDIVYHSDDSSRSRSSTWSYVRFATETPGTGADDVNDMIEERFDDELDEAKDWDPDRDDDGQCILHTERVAYLDGGMASIRIERRLTDWRGHEWSEVSGAFYDLDTGEELSVGEFVGMGGADIRDKAGDAVDAFLRRHPDLDGDGLEDIISDMSRYYVAPEGLVIAIGSEDLHGAAGTVYEIVVDGLDFDTAAAPGSEIDGGDAHS